MARYLTSILYIDDPHVDKTKICTFYCGYYSPWSCQYHFEVLLYKGMKTDVSGTSEFCAKINYEI